MFRDARVDEAAAIAALRTRVAEDLTERFGVGHWSAGATVKGVQFAVRNVRVMVGTSGGQIVASFVVTTRKPWSIDTAYFVKGKAPLYVIGMSVEPTMQGKGLGRKCVAEVVRMARADGRDAVRLDAYDTGETGARAGGFYRKCGFKEVRRVVYKKVPLIYFEMLLG